MAGLKDQLLKAGLVNEKQIKQAQKEKHKEQKQSRPAGAEADSQRIRQAQAEKAERDRQLNQQRKEAQDKKAVAAQIRQLIEAHRLAREEGEIPFNFTDGTAVKRMHLTESVRDRLVRGVLAIVRLDGKYELVPADIAERIAERDERYVVLRNPLRKEETAPADDPYAAYQVPDDLIW